MSGDGKSGETVGKRGEKGEKEEKKEILISGGVEGDWNKKFPFRKIKVNKRGVYYSGLFRVNAITDMFMKNET